jgi:hypothetical protein
LVTLTIADDDVEVAYAFARTPAPTAEEAAAVQAGADDMLARIAEGVARSVI